jgi:uncharacterized protein with NAD-binding domain and iron-sulfur cluster
MKHRPVRPPRSTLEQQVHHVAGGDAAAFEALARHAQLDDRNIALGKASSYEGVGTIDAHVVVRLVPVDVARSLLPLGLELAPQSVTFPDRHPLVMIFAHDFFQAWFGDMDYHELMFAVPYVRLEDSHAANRGPFLYMPRLYLDELAPRLLGNLLYGFEKLEANITAHAGRFRVKRRDNGKPIATAHFEAVGDPGPATAFASFEVVRQLLEQPTISQALRIADEDAFADRDFLSPFLCTNVRYDFGDPTATLQPVRAQVWISPETSPAGLPVGTFDTPSLAEHELGSFRMRAPQVVSLPGPPDVVRYVPSPPRRKRKIVVLGGGPSACVAAYYLARQTDRFEVDLYTQGWRLGGKCGAGRNTERAYRIEEHGLHAFIGFYENAFRAVRDVYRTAELPLDGPAGPLTEAFIGVTKLGVMDRFDDEWAYFTSPQKYNGKEPGVVPGDGIDDPPNLGRAVTDAMGHIARETASLIARDGDAEKEIQDRFEERKADSRWAALVEDMRGFFDVDAAPLRVAVARLSAYVEELAAEQVVQEIEAGSRLFRGIGWLLEVVRSTLRRVLADRIQRERDVWFIWSGLDTVLTIVIGLIDSRTVDFDDLDRYDFREWLLLHGLDPRNHAIASITEVYETLFAHFDDRPMPGKLAAGVGLRWYVLIGFLYRGHPAYDFRSACPETIIAPYYLALQRLGVRVHFFHRVTKLHVEGGDEDRTLRAIDLDVQATVKAGPAAYDPFLPDLPGEHAWPLHPLYDQLEEGDALRDRNIDLENVWSDWSPVARKQLRQGVDFDACVLALPLPVLPSIASDLLDPASPAHAEPWARMCEGIAVTHAHSAQLWLRSAADELFSHPIGLLTGFAAPEPSLGDFSHLLARERWGDGPDAPKFIAYHTGSDVALSIAAATQPRAPDYPEAARLAWRDRFTQWLREHYRELYDRAPASFDAFLELMAAPEGTHGLERLWAQYFVMSVQPSDLYVLSQPEATQLRLAPHESWVKHLVLAGDWTRTDLNCGCVEAATQSGMLASRVLSNAPTYVWHPGF